MAVSIGVVALENRRYSQVIGSAQFSLLNANVVPLAVTFSRYWSVDAASQPNYICLWAGARFGVTDDSRVASGPGQGLAQTNLFGQAEAASIKWAGYCEALPGDMTVVKVANGGGYNYMSRHFGPVADFATYNIGTTAATHYSTTLGAVKDSGATTGFGQAAPNWTTLTTDLNSASPPRLWYFGPQPFNQGHAQGPTTGVWKGSSTASAPYDADAFINRFVAQVKATTWYTNGGILIIWWDEGDGTNDGVSAPTNLTEYSGGRCPLIVISKAIENSASAGTLVTGQLNNYGLLHDIEAAFGFTTFLQNAGNSAATIGAGVVSPYLSSTGPTTVAVAASDSASFAEATTVNTSGNPQTPGGWLPDIIDGTGRTTAGGFDGLYFYAGSDASGIHRAPLASGVFGGFNSGIGLTANTDQFHVAAVTGNNSAAWALVGKNSAGGIKRRIPSASAWTSATTAYWGNATNADETGTIHATHPRHTGRRIAASGTAVWAAVLRTTTPRYGIVRSRDNGSTWSDFYFDAGSADYDPTVYAVETIIGYVFGDGHINANGDAVWTHNFSFSASGTRLKLCLDAIGANYTAAGTGNVVIHSPQWNIPYDATTGHPTTLPDAANTSKLGRRAFLMACIEGEGSVSGLVVDDPNQTHLDAVKPILTEWGLGWTQPLNQKLYVNPTNSGGVFQAWPFAVWGRVPGGQP